MIEEIVVRHQNPSQVGQSIDESYIAVQQQNLIAAPIKQQQEMLAKNYQSAPVLPGQFAAAALQPTSSSKYC